MAHGGRRPPRAYETRLAGVRGLCAPRSLQPIPATPATVAAFLASETDREFRLVTITRRARDHPNPCGSGAVLSGIRRQHGTRPLRQAKPLELDPLARLLEPIDTATLAGLRDRALLLLGFAAALRRSELVALDAEDLEHDPACRLLITIPASKTDEEQAGNCGRGAIRALEKSMPRRRNRQLRLVDRAADWGGYGLRSGGEGSRSARSMSAS